MANSRTYVASLPGGTATTTVQVQKSGTLKRVTLSMIAAAAGSVEVSRNSSSQIATAQPTSDVIARMRLSATAAQVQFDLPVSQSFSILDNIYIHQTGAGNVGEANLVF